MKNNGRMNLGSLLFTLMMAGWVCHATDYQGSFGDGYGATKSEAQLQALNACQLRSRVACVVNGCFPNR
jgi:hypothetical protein